MKSFSELARESGSFLAVDAASTQIQVATVAARGEVRSATSDREAGIGIFECLEELAVDLSAIGAFVYCEGPGSILGIRTAAMALRIWNLLLPRSTYAYRSLEFLAAAQDDATVTYIADARRGHWHSLRLGDELKRVLAADLKGSIVTPKNFRAWMTPPADTRVVDYCLSDLISRSFRSEILRPRADPDAYLAEAPVYATWQPQVHQAP